MLLSQWSPQKTFGELMRADYGLGFFNLWSKSLFSEFKCREIHLLFIDLR